MPQTRGLKLQKCTSSKFWTVPGRGIVRVSFSQSLSPCLKLAIFFLCPHMVPLYIYVQISSYKDISHIGLQPVLATSLKALYSNPVTFGGWELGLPHVNFGRIDLHHSKFLGGGYKDPTVTKRDSTPQWVMNGFWNEKEARDHTGLQADPSVPISCVTWESMVFLWNESFSHAWGLLRPAVETQGNGQYGSVP
jgi:hypothetical protein